MNWWWWSSSSSFSIQSHLVCLLETLSPSFFDSLILYRIDWSYLSYIQERRIGNDAGCLYVIGRTHHTRGKKLGGHQKRHDNNRKSLSERVRPRSGRWWRMPVTSQQKTSIREKRGGGRTHYKDSERISNDNNRTTGTTRRKEEGRKKRRKIRWILSVSINQ